MSRIFSRYSYYRSRMLAVAILAITLSVCHGVRNYGASPDGGASPVVMAGSGRVGPAGGVVILSHGAARGAQVAIPPGALRSAVQITVSEGAKPNGLPLGVKSVGPLVVFGPEGQTFLRPVTITLPTTGTANSAYIRPVSSNAWTRLADAHLNSTGHIVATTTHFSEATSTNQSPVGSVWTNRYDNNRSGANTQELQLTTTNVNPNSFGLLASHNVDGAIYAQPLVVQNVAVSGAVHNVVYVATAHNSVYAYDADVADSMAMPLWSKNLGPSVPVSVLPNASCNDMLTEIGITSTPVIKVVSQGQGGTMGTMYVVAKTYDGTYVHHWLYALDLADGSDRIKPVEISATAPGTAIQFNSATHLNRPGLLLDSTDTLYIAFGSHCDKADYHGWILTYNSHDLTQTGVYITTPSGEKGAIWQSGFGLAADINGVYAVASNGTFSSDGSNLGLAVIQLSRKLRPDRWYIPADAETIVEKDLDLSSGPVLAPDVGLMFVGSKDTSLHVLRSDNLAFVQAVPQNGQICGGPVYWQGPAGSVMYVWSAKGPLRQYAVSAQGVSTQPVSTFAFPQTRQCTERNASYTIPCHPGGILTLSSNGKSTGTGIVWATLPISGDAWHSLSPGGVYAFDAEDVSKLLWSDETGGNFAKFTPPVVANGKLYVATFSNWLNVYGLKAP